VADLLGVIIDRYTSKTQHLSLWSDQDEESMSEKLSNLSLAPYFSSEANMSQFSFSKPKSILINCYKKNFDEESLGPFISSNLVSIEIVRGSGQRDSLTKCW
jgi:hypothetical protein